jgi:hypothetical protein
VNAPKLGFALAVVTGLLFACSADVTTEGFGKGTSGGTSSGSITSGGTSGASGTGFGTGDSGTMNPDAPPADGCRNIDILFVIDDSASMSDEQEALIKSFDGFVSGIKNKLGNAQSYHIGVTTSSDYRDSKGAECERIGTLVTRTQNGALNNPSCKSSNRQCGPFASGHAYMDEREPNLADKFRCAAQVGACGDDDEKMMKSMLTALQPGINAKGGCNEGFLRKDSLLITVLLTDEEDVPETCDPSDVSGTNCKKASGGDPNTWYNEFIQAHGPRQNNIVMAIVPGQDCRATGRIKAFADKFGANGHAASICLPDYSKFFSDALPSIKEACQNIVTPN